MHHVVESNTCLDAHRLVQEIHADLGNISFVLDIADPQGSLFRDFIAVTNQGHREYSGWASPGFTQQIFHTHNLPTILATTCNSLRSRATLVIDIEVARQVARKYDLDLRSSNAIEMDAELSDASFSWHSEQFRTLMHNMQNEINDADRISWNNIPSGYSRFALVPSQMHLHAQEIILQPMPDDDLKSDLRWAFLPIREGV